MNYSLLHLQVGRDEMYKTWHSLNNKIMLMLVSKGNGNAVFHENVYHFTEGTLIFVNADKQHYTMPENFNEYIRSKLFLPLEFFANILNLVDKSGKIAKQFFSSSGFAIKLKEKDFARAKDIFEELNEYQVNNSINNSLLISACTRLISFFIETTPTPLSEQKNNHFITRTILYINEHITENLTIEEICSHAFISKYYFCREFKRYTGLSVMKYILLSRLSFAQELMRDTDLTISEIAYRAGFSSSNYFCNVFKKENGITPKEFRKNNKK